MVTLGPKNLKNSFGWGPFLLSSSVLIGPCGPLKNAIFCTLIGAAQIPWAKTASVIFLVPLLIFYTKILDTYKREKTFYIISGVYCALALIFTVLLAYTPTAETCKAVASPAGWTTYGATILAYAFYIFVESYGSLIPALFWAIASDTTSPDSAKKGILLCGCHWPIWRHCGALFYCQSSPPSWFINKRIITLYLRNYHRHFHVSFKKLFQKNT